MGKKTKLQGDPDLAKNHKAGAKVVLFQNLNHDPLGAIGYSCSELWVFEAQLAEESYCKLQELHERVADLSPGSSNIRSIHDSDLLRSIYGTGTEMVSHAIRSVQHLAECMERAKGTSLKGTTVIERIREAVALFGINDYASNPGYQGFVVLVKIRNAVEHPKGGTIYQYNPARWDEVPLAWLLSDRSLKDFSLHSEWFNLMVDEWNAHCQANLQPRNFTILTRGLKSILSVKKPQKRKK